MARKDDLKILFNFLIELLKDEEEQQVKVVEETTKFGSFDVPRIKTIMDKMDKNTVVKQALNFKAKDYKKEIDELREAFNKKVLEDNKLEDDSKTTIVTPDGFLETKK